PGAAPRYSMLATIREFALAALTAASEEPAARTAHAAALIARAETAIPALRGPDSSHWLHLLEQDHDNLRAALAWSTNADPGAALALAGGYWRFWHQAGHWREARLWIDSALAAAPEPAASLTLTRVHALLGAAVMADRLGDLQDARSSAEQALAIARQLADPRAQAQALNILGIIADEVGDLAASITYLTEAIDHLTALGETAAVIDAITNLSNTAGRNGQSSLAVEMLLQALNMAQDLNDRRAEFDLLLNLGAIHELRGDPSLAQAAFDLALPIAQEHGSDEYTGQHLLFVAAVLEHLGELDQAQATLSDALGRLANANAVAYIPYAQLTLGRILIRQQQHGAARPLIADALRDARQIGLYDALIEALDTCAAYAAATHRPDLAALLGGAASQAQDAAGNIILPGYVTRLQHYRPALEAALGSDAYHTSFARGRALPFDQSQSIAQALLAEDDPDIPAADPLVLSLITGP
ncbi:MAG: hypothetical protein ACR2J8_03730, partial [Thermomicrobiales bacterium]